MPRLAVFNLRNRQNNVGWNLIINSGGDRTNYALFNEWW